MEWIDTHAHLDDRRLESRLPAVLAAARAAGVARIVTIGIDVATSRNAVRLAGAHDEVFAAVALQPNSVAEAQPGDMERIAELAAAPKVVAIGETGLDRYWDRAPFALQQEFFVAHLELARTRGLPAVIHARDAEHEVADALRRFADEHGAPIAGVLHSYTGDAAAAAACVALGLHVSFAGMLTYRKSDALRAVAATVPRDRLLVETDAPYLSPEPFRGQPNEPARVVHTGACLAEVHGMTVAELAALTTANARALFKLP